MITMITITMITITINTEPHLRDDDPEDDVVAEGEDGPDHAQAAVPPHEGEGLRGHAHHAAELLHPHSYHGGKLIQFTIIHMAPFAPV